MYFSLLVDVRFRPTPEALEYQPSLAYSLVRNYLDLGQKERLLPLLHDQVKYGIFLDRFSANLLLNAFLLEKKYKGKEEGVRV